MSARPPWHSLHWQGTVRDGGLLLADWQAWQDGHDAELAPQDLPALVALMQDGRVIGDQVPPVALLYLLVHDLFHAADGHDGEWLATEFEERAERLCSLVDAPYGNYAFARVQDVCDLHCYWLQADELAARLFMEVRRLECELRERQGRLWAHAVSQTGPKRVFAIDSGHAYGLGRGLLGWLNELATPEACWAVDDVCSRLLRQRMRRVVAEPSRTQVVLAPVIAVDDQHQVWCSRAMAQVCEAIPASRSWAVVPRVAWCSRSRPDGVAVPATCFGGVITETWSEASTELDFSAPGVGLEQPPAF